MTTCIITSLLTNIQVNAWHCGASLMSLLYSIMFAYDSWLYSEKRIKELDKVAECSDYSCIKIDYQVKQASLLISYIMFTVYECNLFS